MRSGGMGRACAGLRNREGLSVEWWQLKNKWMWVMAGACDCGG